MSVSDALDPATWILLTRQAGSTLPCPTIDFDAGFNEASLKLFFGCLGASLYVCAGLAVCFDHKALPAHCTRASIDGVT